MPHQKQKRKSRAAIQREYRRRRDADPEKRASYLMKERAKYIRDKESGTHRSVDDMSERCKQKQRKNWRKWQERHRAKIAIERQFTPPSTPPSVNIQPLSAPALSCIP